MVMGIPDDRRERNPLITEAAYRRLTAMLQHPAAPAWNYEVGDRVVAEDLSKVEEMREAVSARRVAGRGVPPPEILHWVGGMRPRVRAFERAIRPGLDLERDWASVATMCRADIATRIEDIVPRDELLDRLIVYDTSGVTGHAIRVPHHPCTIAQNHALIEFVLAEHGVRLDFSPDVVAAFNVGAQVSTVVFATVFSVWNQAGFAKVNLHPRAWNPASARRFFADHAPMFLTGDPLGFAEMQRWDIEAAPAALLSTAVALLPGLKASLAAAYRCPVIDTYATTETGPIAYASSDGQGLSILPPDIYLEIVDRAGQPVPEGEYGEICVTGGRNPFVPLLRYRTGDFGRLRWTGVEGADPMPRILDLSAREAVSFRAADGSVVSPVDIGRVIRRWTFVQHAFRQRADDSCDLVIRPAPGCPIDLVAMEAGLQALFGTRIRIDVRLDLTLGDERAGGKVVPFSAEPRTTSGER
jgi:phenylacetate-CoA ligase